MIIYSKETIGEQIYLVLTNSNGNISKLPYSDEESINADLTIIKTNLQTQVTNKTLEIASIDLLLA